MREELEASARLGLLRRATREEAAEIWRDLERGAWNVADRFDDRAIDLAGRRFVVAWRRAARANDAWRSLTARERTIVSCAAAGCSNRKIAADLGVSPSTVAGHLSSAMRKLAVSSRLELLREARRKLAELDE